MIVVNQLRGFRVRARQPREFTDALADTRDYLVVMVGNPAIAPGSGGTEETVVRPSHQGRCQQCIAGG